MSEIAPLYRQRPCRTEPRGRSQPVFNPATGEQQNTVALASSDEVARAVASAKTAWESWSKTPPLRRARILDRFKMFLWDRADELARAISLDAWQNPRRCTRRGDTRA